MCASVYELFHHLTAEGVDVFQTWLDQVRDPTAVARIIVRLDRIQSGNFGDTKPVGEGEHDV